MKRNYKFIIPIILLAGVLVSFTFRYRPDPEKDKALVQILRYVLGNGHYQPVIINDEFSENVFTDFIETIDPTKHYFLQSDIDEFTQFKHQIDDQILQDDLSFFYLVYDRLMQRIKDSESYYKEILSYPFNIYKPDSISVNYENIAFSKNKTTLVQLWQKQLKMRYLSRLYNMEEAELDKEKTDSSDTYTPKTFDELRLEAREKIRENMDDFYTRINELNRDDWFSYFLNAITAQFGPHTNYFTPKTKKRFDIAMAGKLEGIGARLVKKGEYTKVTELISGGPAWLAGELEVGDIILKVAQGDEEPLDIVGMRLDDAIEYIKGKKGTEVRLTLKKVDGSIKVISIIRDVVELEETFVKSAIVEKDGRKYGIVNLPKFYIDFDERSYRNAATDMAQELKRLHKEGVEGILIDLRNNGGGSLKTAIEIAGLFIDEGPVVQVKYRGENAKIREDKDSGVHWKGSLVVLVNELSASASEIFAAAMQDYKRAIILGGKQTFGKGTVQNFYPLNKYVRGKEDMGALKMTIQKFYRVDGGSTQLKGVTPDIIVPSRYSYLDIGERDENKPMDWDKISAANYIPWDAYKNYDFVIKNSKKRILNNPQFQLIDSNAKWLKEVQKDSLVYLEYDAFKKDIEIHNEKVKEFDALDNYSNGLSFLSPQYEIPLMEADSVLAMKREVWHNNLSEDVYIDEGLNILEEIKIKPQRELVKS